jgi:hypothetical protein
MRAVGTHMSHAARLEPVTPPGHVYASEAFAALAACEGETAFTCAYVGTTPWAKDYGRQPTYRLIPEPEAVEEASGVSKRVSMS